MGTRERIEKAILAETLPEWVDRVVVREMFDADGAPALDVVLVIRDDRIDVVRDGSQLADARHLVHRAVRSAAVRLWPYTRFMSVSDLAAA
jgi:hypothetical protein